MMTADQKLIVLARALRTAKDVLAEGYKGTYGEECQRVSSAAQAWIEGTLDIEPGGDWGDLTAILWTGA